MKVNDIMISFDIKNVFVICKIWTWAGDDASTTVTRIKENDILFIKEIVYISEYDKCNILALDVNLIPYTLVMSYVDHKSFKKRFKERFDILI